MQQCSRISLSIVTLISKHRETGRTHEFLCLALFAGCRFCVAHLHCPKKIAMHHQLKTVRLSTGEVTLREIELKGLVPEVSLFLSSSFILW